MFPPPPRVIYATLFFVLVMALILIAKPWPVFESDGTVTPFGVGERRTVFPLGVVTSVVAVLSMFTFTLIDVIYG
jgi:hypothetical protein